MTTTIDRPAATCASTTVQLADWVVEAELEPGRWTAVVDGRDVIPAPTEAAVRAVLEEKAGDPLTVHAAQRLRMRVCVAAVHPTDGPIVLIRTLRPEGPTFVTWRRRRR